jgi:hypothetical protein
MDTNPLAYQAHVSSRVVQDLLACTRAKLLANKEDINLKKAHDFLKVLWMHSARRQAFELMGAFFSVYASLL